jgi:hypothetical protein
MHAQFMNAGWSVTYIGPVSYMKLVLTTSTSVCWGMTLPVDEKTWLGSSSKRRATSMFRNRSPRLDPSAMTARWDVFIPRQRVIIGHKYLISNFNVPVVSVKDPRIAPGLLDIVAVPAKMTKRPPKPPGCTYVSPLPRRLPALQGAYNMR